MADQPQDVAAPVPQEQTMSEGSGDIAPVAVVIKKLAATIYSDGHIQLDTDPVEPSLFGVLRTLEQIRDTILAQP